MSQESDIVSRLALQTKNIGYYAGFTFGLGYSLTLLGIIAVVAEIMIRISSYMPGYYSTVTSFIPSWLIVALILIFIGIICGVYFGFTVIKNSKNVRDFGLTLNAISSSVFAFSFMLIFIWLGNAIASSGLKTSLFNPTAGIVGAILLLIGFKIYSSKTEESKIIGAIMMLISVILIYIVALSPLRDLYKSYFGTSGLSSYIGFSMPPLPGVLMSELNIETVTLLIVTLLAVVLSFPILIERLKQPITGLLLSICGIIFSCGLLYFNFSALSWTGKIFSTPGQPFLSPWIIFFGFLILGISGIIALIASCLPLAISIKQLSLGFEVPQVKKPETIPPSENVKYCLKCGTAMPLDSTYCPKCGQKQPKT
jgi:ribosomal protein L40E